MEILVMGGTEFVSSSLAQHLISKGYAVDIFTRGIKSIKYAGVRNHFQGNRKSAEDLQRILDSKKYDYVFDISAYTKEDVEKLVSTLNKNHIKRYIFCSSGSVYTPTNDLIMEDAERGENINWGDYGLNKKEAEDYLLGLYEEENFPVTIFRPTYIYGKGNNLYREVYLFDRITEGLEIPIPDGNNTEIQFVHIKDLVKTFESAVFSDKAVGQAYNLTHPEHVSWEYLAKVSMEAVEREVNVEKINMKNINMSSREFFPFRDVTYLLSIEKLKEDRLHVPQINLREGLKKSYEWYCEEKPKLKDLKMNKIDLVLK